MINNMKKFIGTKEVLGKPMNRLEYNQYRGWDLPEDEDGSDEGVLVEYINSPNSNHPDHKGYISWSPKKQFEDAYRECGTYTQRLEIERDELSIKIKKLHIALGEGVVPKEALPDLRRQLDIMNRYLEILEKRIG